MKEHFLDFERPLAEIIEKIVKMVEEKVKD